MNSYIINKVGILANQVSVNGDRFFSDIVSAEDLYRRLNLGYAKFFKMDTLCKWALLGAECVMKNGDSYVYEGLDKTKIAVVLMTNNGCMDVDKRYWETTKTIPSPALFVYTLPNIMLGEICIRHGFKGEQLSLVSDTYNQEEINFWVDDLIKNRGMAACLMGWVDVKEDEVRVEMNWVAR
ncbi:MAG TPA: hypothetical protein VL098_13070 [Flavipsychrobacter sp.]|nr:hypothetical protein [Flavipsychrobacter sp.]